MSKSIQLEQAQLQVFDMALGIMSTFKLIFGRELSVGNLAEIYVARHLGLDLAPGVNTLGYDAIHPITRETYQIKYRSETTVNVEVNNFQFDNLVLVNLDADYRLTGMWLLTRKQVLDIFEAKPNTKQSQARQAKVKMVGKNLLRN